MTAAVIPLFKSDEGTISRDGKRDSSTLIYLARGITGGRPQALSLVRGVAPTINPSDNLALQSMAAEHVAHGAWVVRCEYGVLEPLDVGDFTWSWDTTGATAHMTVPHKARVYARVGYTPPADLKKVIAVDRDRRVQGTDVPCPSLKLTLSYRFPRAVIGLPWVRAISRLVGKCNLKPYAGFDAYELLFLGSTGKQGWKIDPTIDLHFLAGENLVNKTLAGILIAYKRAHELIWPWFGDAKDGTADELITKPLAFYVDEVAEPADFYTLQTANVPGGSAGACDCPEPSDPPGDVGTIDSTLCVGDAGCSSYCIWEVKEAGGEKSWENILNGCRFSSPTTTTTAGD